MRIVKKFNSEQEGIKEWRSVMKMDPDAEGCPCCGPPHTFDTYTDEEGDREIIQWRKEKEEQYAKYNP